jgi:hypothetical protein
LRFHDITALFKMRKDELVSLFPITRRRCGGFSQILVLYAPMFTAQPIPETLEAGAEAFLPLTGFGYLAGC